MWRSSRSLLLSAAFALTTAAVAAVVIPALPPSVAAQLPQLKVQGGGKLTLFGMSIYDIQLYRPANSRGEWSIDEPFALQLVYHRSLKGPLIAARSIDEMAKLGACSADQRARWGDMLRRILPDVDAGDRLTGVNVPMRGVQFYQNGKLIGSVDDGDFAQSFFGIWLDPGTAEPALRRQLLGLAP